jgi:hypothetical protein
LENKNIFFNLVKRCWLQQGCEMVCFQTKNLNLGKFCRVLLWKILVYFMTIWSILQPFGIFCGNLVYFSPFWYFGPRKIWQPWATGDARRHFFPSEEEADEPLLSTGLPTHGENLDAGHSLKNEVHTMTMHI